MNPSLRQLKGFLLVAQLGNFTRAAEQLHITQAGLSAMVRDLERQFDCRLFDRTTRSVSLTREGMCLVPSAERVVRELDEAMATVKLATSAAQRVLTIAVTPVFASVLAPAVCRAFTAVDPSVEIRIKDVARSQIQGLVERGEADVGFGIFLKSASGTDLLPLFPFSLVYLARAGSLPSRPATSGSGRLPGLPWSRLPDLPLIGLAAETPVQEVIDRQLQRIGRPIGTGQICNSMQPMLAMVAAGLGTAILPSMVVPYCTREKFDLMRLTNPVSSLRFHQISKKGHRPPPMTAAFVETMSEVVQSMCAAQPD